eukprot:1392479-Amorphochlora_amoeboformis.AAC.1
MRVSVTFRPIVVFLGRRDSRRGQGMDQGHRERGCRDHSASRGSSRKYRESQPGPVEAPHGQGEQAPSEMQDRRRTLRGYCPLSPWTYTLVALWLCLVAMPCGCALWMHAVRLSGICCIQQDDCVFCIVLYSHNSTLNIVQASLQLSSLEISAMKPETRSIIRDIRAHIEEKERKSTGHHHRTRAKPNEPNPQANHPLKIM